MNRTFISLALLLFTGSSFLHAQDSLSIKIGQMILIGIPKAEVDKTVLEEIRKGKAGSLIFFEKNIPAKNSFMGLKKIIWTYKQAAPIPLLVGIDQEGGRVNRLKEKYGFPRSVSASSLGKMPLDSVRFYAESTAATLAGLGFNINFAPVVDLASNPNNPIIARVERPYAKSADSVVLYAREVIRQHQKLGVLTSLKHFPGHGSSKDDTHLGLADVTNTWKEEELKPYQVLIDEGYAETVMTSHIVNRKLDESGNPGTLSQRIIQGVLRDRLHFQGVVFTDDMQMHAITKYYGLEEAIKLTILAGVDVLTFSNNISGSQDRTVDKVHAIIRGFVEDGTIPRERIDESYKRVMALKKRLSASTSDYYRQQMIQTQQDARKAKDEAARQVAEAKEREKAAEAKYNALLQNQTPTGTRKKKNK
jgi:beta-N-acetylhexosaminidase